jgi:hypothetical protein
MFPYFDIPIDEYIAKMNSFRTILPLKDSPTKISHEDQVIFMGSCFAQEMGEKMSRYQFNCCTNPFGILFNPSSLATALDRIIANRPYSSTELTFDDRLFHSFDHHGSFSKPKEKDILEEINQSLSLAHAQLKNSRVLIITFGSAWVYRLISTGKVVANCHKFPQQAFAKELLTFSEIVLTWKRCLQDLKQLNADLQIIFSVSPVRYLRDGFEGNQLSKSHLILAVHELCNEKDVSYFPSYEIQMDDLRDYRFYKSDMLHPSAEAVQYIWEQFINVHIDPYSRQLMNSMEKYILLKEHRSISETEDEKQSRLDKAQRGIETLLNLKKKI